MYVADTHAWVYYLLNKLPRAANQVFSSTENGKEVMFMPTIALGECVYLIGKNKIILTYDELFSRFEESNNFIVVPLTFDITKTLPNINLKELHDKMIVATAKFLGATLITKDKEIRDSNIVKTIWN